MHSENTNFDDCDHLINMEEHLDRVDEYQGLENRHRAHSKYGSGISETTEDPHGQCVSTMNIDKIVIDPSYYGRIKEDPDLIKAYQEAYMAGKELPPIILEPQTLKLIDGYHRLMAVKRIVELLHEGSVTELEVPEPIRGGFIKYEYGELPKNVAPRLFSLSFNMSNGVRPSSLDIESAISRQFETYPDSKIEDLVDLLGVSKSTATRHASKAIRDRKSKIREFILKCHKDGHIQEKIEEKLKKLYPGVSGTSQATISGVLSKNPSPEKTSKQPTAENSGDLNSSDEEKSAVKVGASNQGDALTPTLPTLNNTGSNPSLYEPISGTNTSEDSIDRRDGSTGVGLTVVGIASASPRLSDSHHDHEKNDELREYSKQLDDRLDAQFIAIKNLDTSTKKEMVQKIENLLSSYEVSASEFKTAVGY